MPTVKGSVGTELQLYQLGLFASDSRTLASDEPIPCLDSQCLYTFDGLGFLSQSPCGLVSDLADAWAPSDLWLDLGEPGGPRQLDRAGFEQLTGCRYTPRLVARTEALLRGYGHWGFSASAAGGSRGGFATAHARGFAPHLARGRTARVVARDCGPALGLGLYALDGLRASSLVGEYAGELVPLAPGAPLDPYGCRYPTRVPAALVSARAWGNAMRLVNHAPRARANAAFEYVHHGGLLRVVIVATRDVAPGEQILADYGPDYWRAHGDAPVVDLGPAASPA